MLALALHHDEIDDDDQIVVDLLALAELEHARTHPAANDLHYPHAPTLAAAPPRTTRVPAPILYEEYHPYGSSAYRAVGSSVEVSAKRYRYTGKERDEETGLDHMGARYYASWLGRWTAADPIGLGDGVNRYPYVRGNPIKLSDPSGTAPPQQQQEIRILRPEELPQDKAIEIGPGGKVEFRDLTPAEIEQGRAEVEKANRQFSENLFKSLTDPRETPRQRERRERGARIKAKQQAGEPLFPAQGTGQAPGRVANTDEYGNYSPYLQAVNETQELYGPDAGPIPGGPADPLIEPIVQEAGPAGDKVFAAFSGAALMKGGFLRPPFGGPSAWARAAARGERVVSPNDIRFTQKSAGGGSPPRTPKLREELSGGWDPDRGAIDVLETPDGLVSLDNTRVAVAQELELPAITARVRSADELLPSNFPAERLDHFAKTAKKLGLPVPKTWGDLFEIRTRSNNLPPSGTAKRPRLQR